MDFFFAVASWGDRTWKKWTKYILAEKNFLKKGRFDLKFWNFAERPLSLRDFSKGGSKWFISDFQVVRDLICIVKVRKITQPEWVSGPPVDALY